MDDHRLYYEPVGIQEHGNDPEKIQIVADGLTQIGY